jgi:hypothetical protein
MKSRVNRARNRLAELMAAPAGSPEARELRGPALSQIGRD